MHLQWFHTNHKATITNGYCCFSAVLTMFNVEIRQLWGESFETMIYTRISTSGDVVVLPKTKDKVTINRLASLCRRYLSASNLFICLHPLRRWEYTHAPWSASLLYIALLFQHRVFVSHDSSRDVCTSICAKGISVTLNICGIHIFSLLSLTFFAFQGIHIFISLFSIRLLQHANIQLGMDPALTLSRMSRTVVVNWYFLQHD